jgi:hypothetical protein
MILGSKLNDMNRPKECKVDVCSCRNNCAFLMMKSKDVVDLVEGTKFPKIYKY